MLERQLNPNHLFCCVLLNILIKLREKDQLKNAVSCAWRFKPQSVDNGIKDEDII